MATTPITIEQIKLAVCKNYGLTLKELTSPAKRKSKTRAAIARQVASFLMKKLVLDTNIKTIGRELGYSDHSTAMKNCKLTLKIMSVDKAFRAEVYTIETKIKAPAGTEA